MRAALLAVVLSAAIVSSTFQAKKEQSNSAGQRVNNRFPESRAKLQGEIWLEWDKKQRTGFIRGFMIGYEVGHKSGCSDGITLFESAHAAGPKQTECNVKSLGYNESIDFYDEKMTEFYRRYPQDRDLPLGRLITELWSPNNKTLEQIHEWLESLKQN